MNRSNTAWNNDFVSDYLKTSTRRMLIGLVICLGIMAIAFFISFPTCVRTDKVTGVRTVGNKYYLNLQGESGTFGMWSESEARVGTRICVRPTFAQ